MSQAFDDSEVFRFRPGIELIQEGKCPIGGMTPMACMFCSYGHMTECHHPETCEEAECSHYVREIDAEMYGGEG